LNRRIVVWLTAAEDHEEEFNRWYEQDYIPRFVQQIPGIERVTRWKTGDGSRTYITEYELTPGADFEDVAEALRSPDREADRTAWKQHEDRLPDFRDGLFVQVFEHDGSGGTRA
jgi:hypothetical protein